ncbi:MAG: thioredoxin family protein [Cenarchaeum sp. SB0665_bin_23]|nr:thioredoxin family protein [Cenarchaeum sp. SB0667_bin_13]MXY37396.1 thioredoxin family protein [Cenarchaeum sp. SB0664_bin_35]MXY61524.1 thioredoxin family protein [Cenarchaeum sp. SB0665_bin_23]MXZ93091.1 thioredoxin family protein [Cenarchaeum sp. SB0666_bin_15]MYB47598.1 thioredoxin family protein [Cenarchaeum sp. SB0662_bin_33]MYC79251.1 thioredoxin family protein [Cenarchaeum sp. SB0661_bin_35]MYD59178.1 thioredoxin family protein [Cenarchaeum sp. SB0678_bin_8]MYG33674.1 thioredoxin
MDTDPEVARIMAKKMRERMFNTPRTIVDANDGTLQNMLHTNSMLLLDFWAEWCGPCRALHPAFQTVAGEYPSIQFARLNIDKNPLMTAKYAVQSIPTIILFHKGRPVHRMTGMVGASGIRDMCKSKCQSD